jgi:hypothetical protein
VPKVALRGVQAAAQALGAANSIASRRVAQAPVEVPEEELVAPILRPVKANEEQAVK